MKKIVLTIVCAVIAMTANAEMKFKSLNNFNGVTTVVLVEDNASEDFPDRICCAQFSNNGKTFDAKSMVCKWEGSKATITMTFKKQTVFQNMSVSLNIDQKAVVTPIDLIEVAAQLSPKVKLLLE